MKGILEIGDIVIVNDKTGTYRYTANDTIWTICGDNRLSGVDHRYYLEENSLTLESFDDLFEYNRAIDALDAWANEDGFTIRPHHIELHSFKNEDYLSLLRSE